MIEPLIGPPEHHAGPLNEDGEDQRQQEPFDPLGEGGQKAGDQPLANIPAPRVGDGSVGAVLVGASTGGPPALAELLEAPRSVAR